MKLNLKILLYKHKTYADGTHPIMLQYVLNGKAKRKVITRCKPEEWDEGRSRVKSRMPNAARTNHFITEEFVKAERELYDIRSGEKPVSAIFSNKYKITLQDALTAELNRFEKEFMSGYYDKILAIQKQIKDKSIPLSDIDERWFNGFISSLNEIGNNGATIKKKIKLIRSVIGRYSEKGISSELRAITVQAQKSIKQKLNESEVNALVEIRLPQGDVLGVVRDLFLLQIYLRGIRIGDLLQAYPGDFKDGYFSYKADKTDKTLSIKLIPKAIEIIERYQGKYERLFPFFKWKYDKKATKFENERTRLKHKESCTAIINRHLKLLAEMAGITKPVSSHIARHTFARMAIDKINNPMVTMELLGHSSLAVHQQYLNDIRKDDVLDAAADDIFS
jgi:integrase/recombinase XerD